MIRNLSTIVLAMLAAGGLMAQEGAGLVDLAKGTVDPLDIGGQRARFLRAAGSDSELTREEFDHDARTADGFAKSFDRWENIARFDRNGNGTIDWFEAAAYREDLRLRFLNEYDADKNGRLTGDERERANQALVTGRLPRPLPLAQPAPGAPGAPGAGPPGPDGRRGFGPGGFDRQEFLRRFDTDGDGQISEEEGQRAREEFRQRGEERRREFLERFDTDGDGQISEEEGRRAREEFRQRFGDRPPFGGPGPFDRQEFLRRFDADGDGQISDQERDKVRQEFRERGEEFRRRLVEEFDKDGDGELNDQERRAAFESLRERGFGGFRGRGGEGRDGFPQRRREFQ